MNRSYPTTSPISIAVRRSEGLGRPIGRFAMHLHGWESLKRLIGKRRRPRSPHLARLLSPPVRPSLPSYLSSFLAAFVCRVSVWKWDLVVCSFRIPLAIRGGMSPAMPTRSPPPRPRRNRQRPWKGTEFMTWIGFLVPFVIDRFAGLITMWTPISVGWLLRVW